MRLSLLISFLLFYSCSSTIDSLENYKEVDFEQKDSETKSSKYRIETNISEISNHLKDSSLMEFTSQNPEYRIDLKIYKTFENITFGKLEIWNLRFSRVEKSFLFSEEKKEEIFEKAILEVKKFFRYIRGYIVEKREDYDGEKIFKISIGSGRGIAIGKKVNIFGFRERESFLTQEKKLKFVKVGVGTVSNKIEKDSSWIFTDSKHVQNGDTIFLDSNFFGDYIFDGKLIIDEYRN